MAGIAAGSETSLQPVAYRHEGIDLGYDTVLFGGREGKGRLREVLAWPVIRPRYLGQRSLGLTDARSRQK